MNHRNCIFLTCLNRSPEYFKAPSTPTLRIKNMRFQNVPIRFLALGGEKRQTEIRLCPQAMWTLPNAERRLQFRRIYYSRSY